VRLLFTVQLAETAHKQSGKSWKFLSARNEGYQLPLSISRGLIATNTKAAPTSSPQLGPPFSAMTVLGQNANWAEVPTMLRNKPWTKDEERRLVELRASGKSCVLIAAALKRTARAVNSRMSILRKRTAEDDPNGAIGTAQGAAS
jgi:hypothetical protein